MPHFGPKVIGELAYAKDAEVEAVAGHHFGNRVVDLPAASKDIREMGGPAAIAYVETIEDQAKLRALHAQEREHPKYAGGRRTVLDAIEEALGEEEVEDPNEGDDDPDDEE